MPHSILLVLFSLAISYQVWVSPQIPAFWRPMVGFWDWSLAIYRGPDPFSIAPPPGQETPVLTAAQVTDIPAEFLADPFLVREGGAYYLFFEVMNNRTHQGDIGLAASPDGWRWHYQRIVLDEPFHLSYPCVFKYEGQYYMVPESLEANSVRLYRAADFPTKWTLVRTLLLGDYIDPTVFSYDGRWWMFVGANPSKNDTLLLFHAESPLGPWKPHPRNPIIRGDARIARPGGRVLIHQGRPFRFTQDCSESYGRQVRVFEIPLLTTRAYGERMVDRPPIVQASGRGWNARGMHHVDLLQTAPGGEWMASVDGFQKRFIPGRLIPRKILRELG